MKTEIVNITPKIAEKYLAKNESNRALSKSRVLAYADDIKNNRWAFNPNPIVFDVSGKLIDGQHRLHAVISCGISVEMLVMTGAPIESGQIIDFGKPRTAGDVLKIDGIQNANNIAALARLMLAFDTGKLAIIKGSNTSGSAGHFTSATKKEVIEYAKEKFEEINEYVAVSLQIYSSSPVRLMSPSEIGLLLYALRPYESALEFITKIISGVGLNERTPELAARRVIERARVTKERPTTSAELTQLIFIAFEKYMKREECEFLRLPKNRSL